MKPFLRGGMAAVALAVAGCQAVRDAFSAHPRLAASAAGQDLTVDQLTGWVSRVKRPPTGKSIAGLASAYVDYMVFAAQLAKGRNMGDSLLVLSASWPTVSQLRWNRFHDQLFTARAQLTSGQVDSAYGAGQVRLFQHILIQVPASATPQEVERKRLQTEGLLRQISNAHGNNFAALARRYSEDPGSKARGGYLPTTGRGQFVAPFEVAAWELAPGGVSGVVRSPFGFHVIRRPPLNEVRDPFTADVARLAQAHLDSVYVGNLAAEKQIKVKEGAPVLVRQVFEDVAAARNSSKVLTTYRGGALRVRDLVRWLFAIDPEETGVLPTASDEQLQQFLTVVTERELLLQQVDSAGVQLTPADWSEVKAEHDSGVDAIETALAISPQLFRDSAATIDARVGLAATHVKAYMERAVQGETRFVPLSPFLAAALRDSEQWSVSPAGVAEVAERASARRGRGDTTTQRGVRRAPGPPPIPLDTTPHQYVR